MITPQMTSIARTPGSFAPETQVPLQGSADAQSQGSDRDRQSTLRKGEPPAVWQVAGCRTAAVSLQSRPSEE